MKYWEIIADQISRAGWSYGYVSVFEGGLEVYIVDAHRDDSNRFIVRADDLLTAFLELQNALRNYGESRTSHVTGK